MSGGDPRPELPHAEPGARSGPPAVRQTSPLRLTVLGASPATPNPGGAGSGYLVYGPSARLLLDCGPGVVGRLRARLELDELDAVVISHLHQDHYIDLLSMRYWVKYGPRRSRPLQVFLPPGGRERLAQLGRALDDNPDFFAQVLSLAEYAPGVPCTIGGLQVTPIPVQHYIPCFAFVVRAGDRQLSFSADAAPCASLVEAARDAHLFVCEASLGSPLEDEAEASARGHLAADEAATIARQAGVRRLLLTHYPAEAAAQRLAAARARFGARVALAREGRTYEV